MINKEKECCPLFDLKSWEKKKRVVWKNKLFIKDSMRTIFHMPFPWIIKKKITNLCKIGEEHKVIPKKDWLMLFKDPSAFKSNLYLTVSKPIKQAHTIKISGKFEARVFDGPYKDVPKFMKQMNSELKSKNLVAKQYYVHYAYCPGCAKKYGHNYMILFAQV